MLYQYRCSNDDCNYTTSKNHSMNEHPLYRCEKCGDKLIKVFSTSTPIFKGSGFYTTDYKS